VGQGAPGPGRVVLGRVLKPSLGGGEGVVLGKDRLGMGTKQGNLNRIKGK